jgi:hypothetical protein
VELARIQIQMILNDTRCSLHFNDKGATRDFNGLRGENYQLDDLANAIDSPLLIHDNATAKALRS